MPFTPYHFGPSGFIGLIFRKWIDIPVFILANVVVDLEPLVVILFDLDYPLHGYFHTFLCGAVVAIFWALIAYSGKSLFQWLMKLFQVPYETNFRKMLLSAILGVWFHILLDAPLYTDIQPFWPFKTNPMYGLLSYQTASLLCTIFFVPAIALYIIAVVSHIRKKQD
jgi:membrane-bound metal-dependent hydrolase YbcI (DUF457 family)